MRGQRGRVVLLRCWWTEGTDNPGDLDVHFPETTHDVNCSQYLSMLDSGTEVVRVCIRFVDPEELHIRRSRTRTFLSSRN